MCKRGCTCPYLLIDAASNASAVPLPPGFQLRAGKRPLPASRPSCSLPRKPPVCADRGLFTSPSYQPVFQEAGFSQSRSTWSCCLPPSSRLQLGGPALPSSHSSWTQGSPGRRWAFSPKFSLSQPLPPQEKPPPGSYLLPLGLAPSKAPSLTVHTDWAPALEPGKRDRPGRHLGLVLPLARDLSSEPGEGTTPACSARCWVVRMARAPVFSEIYHISSLNPHSPWTWGPLLALLDKWGNRGCGG